MTHIHLVYSINVHSLISFFFFNDTATTEIYTLSLHDALPIYQLKINYINDLPSKLQEKCLIAPCMDMTNLHFHGDRKSTRLNSSHQIISYAVFCLKKKTIIKTRNRMYSAR